MRSQRGTWGAACRASALACALVGPAGCEFVANEADRQLNELAKPAPTIEPQDHAYHSRFLVIDLHADTLMWRRGLTQASPLGQVDLDRPRAGNVGLQVFSMPTRVPTKDDARLCTDANGSDPAPLLAMASGWPPAAWADPYHRALVQAGRLQDVAMPQGSPRIAVIKSLGDLNDWLCRAGFDDGQIANIAGRNACRVIAQSLSAGSLEYPAARKLCRSPLPPPSASLCHVAKDPCSP